MCLHLRDQALGFGGTYAPAGGCRLHPVLLCAVSLGSLLHPLPLSSRGFSARVSQVLPGQSLRCLSRGVA